MTTLKTMAEKTWHTIEARLELRAEGDALPPGIAGRVSGVALTYETVDSYGTMFARGSASRTIAGRVAKRRVPLLMDHDRSTASHVGVVASMSDVGDALVMTADLFDTPDGRAALEYVRAVIAAGASTGFSIGFVPRASSVVMVDGKQVERFSEIELREVSITPMPAVPGADVTSARHEPEPEAEAEPEPEPVPVTVDAVRDEVTLLRLAAETALRALPATVRADVLAQFGPVDRPTRASPEAAVREAHAAPTPAPAGSVTAPSAPRVSFADRVQAVRRSFHVEHQ